MITVVERSLGFSANSRGSAEEVEKAIIFLALVGAWEGTVAICLTECGTPGGQRQKLYADIERNILELAMQELIWNVREFVPPWTGDVELYG